MKKILLSLGLILSANAWASPMDKMCNLSGDDFGGIPSSAWNKLEKRCERNNILEGQGFSRSSLTFFLNSYCRFDRNVWYEETIEPDLFDFGCVLYAPEGRARIL